jgi:hypothetical protein
MTQSCTIVILENAEDRNIVILENAGDRNIVIPENAEGIYPGSRKGLNINLLAL